MDPDELKKLVAEQNADDTSPLGGAGEDVMDIDDTATSMGLRTDTNGPKELSDDDDMESDKKSEWES